MTELHALSAAELSAAYRRGDLSPVQATEVALARIDAWEPSINAMYLVHREQALRDAQASQLRWQRGEPLSSLDGVPITLKENIYTRGDPAPIGAASSDMTPKTEDAPPAARVREAGCVILGKTTMPDFGMLSSGNSSVHGITRNPWRLDRNPSGSSSGAGAAAAAGYGPLHLGTDIGGSVRLPATHCGIFALKPSAGRIPVQPPFLGRVTGPMTRTVRDSAMLLQVASRGDPRDFTSLPPHSVDYAAGLEGLQAKGLRIGLLTDMGVGLPVDPQVKAAATQAANALASAGASVEPLETFMTAEMLDGMCRFFEARSHHDMQAMSEQQRARVLPFIAEWCNWRAQSFSGRDVMAAYYQVMAIREAAVAAIARFDFVLSPTSPILPYDATALSPGSDPRNALPHIAFTVAYNMSGQPAASLNWSFTPDGLPIGVQIVGQRFDDLGVLRLSRLLEQMRPAQCAWPTPG
jgi:aspartyl-tRNA(Asn)/glutamyl-tRNA(Gln) amidotransferase subunit A